MSEYPFGKSTSREFSHAANLTFRPRLFLDSSRVLRQVAVGRFDLLFAAHGIDLFAKVSKMVSPVSLSGTP